MNLGSNPLLQFGLEATRQEICMNILDDLQAVNYVPFDSDTIGNLLWIRETFSGSPAALRMRSRLPASHLLTASLAAR